MLKNGIEYRKGVGIMLNQLVLVGQIKKVPDSHLIEGDNEMVIEVKRNYKNTR